MLCPIDILQLKALSTKDDTEMEFWQLLIGTLSGFIIAFLAEPVKTFFISRSKINMLREALYREMFSNYVLLKSTKEAVHLVLEEHKIDTKTFDVSDLKLIIRKECYEKVLKEDAITFYMLSESVILNRMYASLTRLSEKMNFNDVSVSVDMLADEIEMSIALGGLRRKTARKVSRRWVNSSFKKKGLYKARVAKTADEISSLTLEK